MNVKISQFSSSANICTQCDYIPFVRCVGAGWDLNNYRILVSDFVNGSGMSGGSGIITTGSNLTNTLRGGYGNVSNGDYSTIVGGGSNCADGIYSGILGGYNNCINAHSSSFIVGSNLSASADYTTYMNNANVSGSIILGNCCITDWSDITAGGSGGGVITSSAGIPTSTMRIGSGNCACSSYSTVVGGCRNVVSGQYSGILGGQCNVTNNKINTFIVGSCLSASADCTLYTNNLNVCGGLTLNKCTINNWTDVPSEQGIIIPDLGTCSTLRTGSANRAIGDYSTVVGGSDNCSVVSGISADYSFVGGGYANHITGTGIGYHVIAGGSNNEIRALNQGYDSIVGGIENCINGTNICTNIIGSGYKNYISGSNVLFNGVLGGQCNCIKDHNNSFIIGSCLSATADCTTFMNNTCVTGQMYGTASYANTASYAATSSYSSNTRALTIGTDTILTCGSYFAVPDLQFPIGSNDVWQFDGQLFFTGGGGHGVFVAMCGPMVSSCLSWAADRFDPVLGYCYNNYKTGTLGSASNYFGLGNGSSLERAHIFGTVENNSGTGTIQVNICTSTLDGHVTLRKGSWLVANKKV